MKLQQPNTRVLLTLLALSVVALGTQCRDSKTTQAAAPETTETKPAPATPIDAKKAELGGKTWEPEWDLIVEKAVPAEMLSTQVPRDVKRFCPRFYEMDETDKRAFWAYFFPSARGR